MRLMMFGRPGSGKSTFATWLGARLQLPVHHLDKYFFVEKWGERSPADFLEILEGFVATEDWIIDGNSTKTLEVRYRRAEVVLYFNLPRILCLWRILRRFFEQDRRGVDDRAPGCSERLTWKFVKYMWTFDQRISTQLPELRSKYPNATFFEIQDQDDLEEVTDFLTGEAATRL